MLESLLLISMMCANAVFIVLFLVPELKERTKSILCVIGVVSVFAMIIIVQPIRMEQNGKALTEFDSNGVYFVEWVRVNGPVVSMKLNLGEKSLSLYYEIEVTRLPMWDGKPESVPAKFKVLTDKTREFYALKPVE